MAERIADEPIERPRVTRRGRHPLPAHAAVGQVVDHAIEVGAHEAPPPRLDAIQEATGEVGDSVQRPVGQSLENRRYGTQPSRGKPAADRSTRRTPRAADGRPGSSLDCGLDGRHAGFAISSTRAASASFSACDCGQIGLKLYHCSGAVAIMSSIAAATSCVARCVSAVPESATSIGS